MLVVSLLCTAGVRAEGPYYFSGGKQILLRVDSSRVTVKFDPNLTPAQLDELIRSLIRFDKELIDSSLIDNFVSYSLKGTAGFDSFVDTLRGLTGFVAAEPYYQTMGGYPLLVGDRICVGFAAKVTKSELDSVNAVFGAQTVNEIEGMPNVWVLRNTKTSQTGALELANQYYALPICDFAHPIFSARPTLSSYKLYDHYHDYQSHIKRVIGSFNDRSVWDFAGLTESVTVAVIDDKIEAHEDLPASRLLPRVSFPAQQPAKVLPSGVFWHGMACAGLIAASHTTDSAAGVSESTGMISLNPRVRILPLTIFGTSNTSGPFSDDIASAITYAYQHDADIISCSWSYSFNIADSNDYSVQFDVINTAISNAHRKGRVHGTDTLGCTIFFASGNDSTDVVAYPARLPSCLAVGATHADNDTVRWEYSQYGPELDLVAPSGAIGLGVGDVFTLDPTGSTGMNDVGLHTLVECGISPNNVNYLCSFGGTSTACPIAAGVASLLLSKDPTLRTDDWWGIENILMQSAVHPGPGGDPLNQLGRGRVDAFRAVLSISHGDANNDGALDINDLFAIIDYVTLSVPLFPSALLGDCDCEGNVDLTDIFWMIDYVSNTGPAPVKPCFEF